ncbi:hypothetical protein D3C76_852140 [compost metagenome]
MKNVGIDAVHALDRKAKSFNEQVFNEEGRKRATRIMNWLIEGATLRKEFCYISLSVGSREHSLVNEVWPLVTNQTG